MSNKEKAELYRKAIPKYKRTLDDCFESEFSGLCSFFKELRNDGDISNDSLNLFLIDLYEYAEDNGLKENSWYWPLYSHEPRLQYLENRLAHYQKLAENEQPK